MNSPIEPSRRGGSKQARMRSQMEAASFGKTTGAAEADEERQGKEEKMVQITVRMPESMRNKLENHFRSNGEYLASGIRRVVVEWYNRQ